MSYVVGVTGRSGSGKTTLVKNLLDHFGPEMITLHTMDNYYRPRHEQHTDDHNYKNFDLPTSFYREQFYQGLLDLSAGRSTRIEEYAFNNDVEPHIIIIPAAPIILVEGLFVFHYEEICRAMDLRVLVDVSRDTCFDRRLIRDTQERGYTAEEVTYRYEHHVEPSYQSYIEPYREIMDVIIDNEVDMEEEKKQLITRINSAISC